ncbi:MAG: ATP-dependent RecD-like DNA helicase [Oscillospiraceae bacterium]|nr:ATP-dependent RecD-like DNA helicase [Oscillospiraceae bacterium]
MNRLSFGGGSEGTVISGSIQSVVYANDENGYAVLRLTLDDGGTATLVGTLPYAAPGEELTAEGTWSTHSAYGDQFRAEHIERVLPDTAAGIYAYLSSGVLKGVGPATARNIVEHFGADSLRVLEEEPEKLAALKGIPERKAREIGAAYRKQSALRRLLEFFSAAGIRLGYAVRLYRSYGEDSMEVLLANPYLLCEDYYGASFADADRLALKLGFGGDSPERVEAAVLFELSHNASGGHCFIPAEKLAGAVCQLIGVTEEQSRDAIGRLQESGEVVRDVIAGLDAVYLRRLFEAETEVAARLLRMRGRLPGGERAEEYLLLAQRDMGLSLAPKQREAVTEAVQYGVFALTGGPGTGKTTTIRAILSVFGRMGLRVSLAAPTGRAAKRMQELTGQDASTVHRLLETGYDPDLGLLVFKRDEHDPLEADAVVLDEASMVDITLMQALLKAMKPGARLILVGDADQLPSVGPGNLLKDLLRSGAVPAVTLQDVFRQAEESRIIVSAHLINRGELPELRNSGGDFFFLRRRQGEEALKTILELCARRLPGNMGIPSEEIQVLSPTRLGVTGTVNLNRELQAALNPPGEGKAEKAYGSFVFRTGDRVMQIRNNYDLLWRRPTGELGAGVYNGDVGRIVSLDISAQTLTVEFEDRSAEYSFELLGELEPAYAMTVHKSQGSEYRAVILALCSGAPNLLNRSVLYTAVTRAISLLVAVGDDAVFARMVENDRTQRRYCGLKTRLAAADA